MIDLPQPPVRLVLMNEQVEELGFKGIPTAGTKVHIEATAVVTRATTEDPDADGDIDFVTVELQLDKPAVKLVKPEKVQAREEKGAKLFGPKIAERDVGGTAEKGEFGAFNRRTGA